MEQSSIEWYAKQLARIGLTDEVIGHLTKEAKEINKKQIIDAYSIGYTHSEAGENLKPLNYYRNTYEKKK